MTVIRNSIFSRILLLLFFSRYLLLHISLFSIASYIFTSVNQCLCCFSRFEYSFANENSLAEAIPHHCVIENSLGVLQ